MFYLTALTAAYLALVRWLVDLVIPGQPPTETFFAVALVCAMFFLIGLGPLLYWSESIVWFAAWLVRRRFVQRWLFGRRPGRL